MVGVAHAAVGVGRGSGRRAVALGGFVVALLMALIAAGVWFAPVGGDPEAATALLVFLGFPPLLNAAFDFASIGLTRHQLRAAVTPGRISATALGRSFFDLIGAAALFLGFKIALITLFARLPAGDAGAMPLPIGPSSTPSRARGRRLGRALSRSSAR